MSPLTLQRTYLPRRSTNNKPAHPAAAASAAAHQRAAPQTNFKLKEKTRNYTTTNRTVRLTRFKPGFEEETERELSRIFRRPPRTYKEDLPFYPWLPPEPRVNFNLNFNF